MDKFRHHLDRESPIEVRDSADYGSVRRYPTKQLSTINLLLIFPVVRECPPSVGCPRSDDNSSKTDGLHDPARVAWILY